MFYGASPYWEDLLMHSCVFDLIFRYARVPTFWKSPGNEKMSWNRAKVSWKILEINEFSGNLGLLKFEIQTIAPFL